MKADDVPDAKILLEAVDEWDALVECLANVDGPANGYDDVAFELGVWDRSAHGGSGRASVNIDLKTAARCLPLIREQINLRLKEMGVEIEGANGNG